MIHDVKEGITLNLMLVELINSTHLSKLIHTQVNPGQVDQSLHGLGQRVETVLPQLKNLQLGQSS